jgi:hypothetical protein
MDEWQDISQSKFQDTIRAYKADLDAASSVIRCLEGLPELQAMHGDLKSRCMRTILSNLLQTVAAIQGQLPPLSAFYTEETTWGSTPVVRVNDQDFQRHRQECVRILDELRDNFQWIHEHLELWHAQEGGKISDGDMSDAWNVTENMVYSDYLQAYTALMARYPQYPMLSTNDSQLPERQLFAMKRVMDEKSAKIMEEIELYLKVYDILWKYWHTMDIIQNPPSRVQRAVQHLRHSMHKLPSQYDLRALRFPWHTDDPVTKFYAAKYAAYPFGSLHRVTRPVVLSNTQSVLHYIQQQHNTLHQALPALPVSLRLEHGAYYNQAVSAIETYITRARPLCIPSLADLRRRERAGR